MEDLFPMKGKFTLKQINKSTGESTVLLEEHNLAAAGFSTAVVNVLTGNGSTNLDDYKFRYFQLGSETYDLSTFDISADIPSAEVKPFMWTLKNPLETIEYGQDSVLPIVNKPVYGLGSIHPVTKNKVFDNFVDPPHTTTISDDFTNNFKGLADGQKLAQGYTDSAQLSSIWYSSCAKDWLKTHQYMRQPLFVLPSEFSSKVLQWTPRVYSVAPSPNFTGSVYDVSYNTNVSVEGIVAWVQTNPEYVFYDGTRKDPWNVLKANQTASIYGATEYCASSDISNSGCTPITGALHIYNNTASAGTGFSEAAENKVTFQYRYNLDNSSISGALPPLSSLNPAWYPPAILSGTTKTGYDSCFELVGDCSSNWKSLYGATTTGGTLSANVYCVDGAIYSPADVTGAFPYSTHTGPGADCYDTSNSGFGPSGNFYRVSVSLMDVPTEITKFDNGVLTKAPVAIRYYPMLSSLSSIIDGDIAGTLSGHNITPRERAYLANFQFEYGPSATAYQNIQGERPRYVTSAQDFVRIPHGYTTNLNPTTTNVRLLLDEYLANGQTIKEVGLFMKNPGGNPGTDNPYLCGYKTLTTPINKNAEFSYIIDWELSVVDIGNI